MGKGQTFRDKPFGTNLSGQTFRDKTYPDKTYPDRTYTGLKLIGTKPKGGKNLSEQTPSAKRTWEATKEAILVLKTPKEYRLLRQNHMQKGA